MPTTAPDRLVKGNSLAQVYLRRLSNKRREYWVLLSFAASSLSSCGIDPTVVKCNFVRRAHELSLPMLQHADEFSSFQQRIMGSGIEPGKPAPKPFDGEPPLDAYRVH